MFFKLYKYEQHLYSFLQQIGKNLQFTFCISKNNSCIIALSQKSCLDLLHMMSKCKIQYYGMKYIMCCEAISI